MSEMSGEGGQGFEGGNGGESSVADQGQGGTSTNPAWSELLGIIPEDLHSQVTPHLQKWDQNYQQGISKVHSEYEGFKPYIENEINPEEINYALQIAYALNQSPEEFLQELAKAQGVELPQNEQGQNDNQQIQGGEEDPEWLNHPKFKQLSEMVDTMAQMMVQQNESLQDQQEDELLNHDLDEAQQKYGEFDEEWVLSKIFNAMQRGEQMTVDEAVQQYQQFTTGILQSARKPGPRVMSANGGSPPNSQFDPKKASGKERRDQIAQILAAANQQNG